MEVMGTPFVPIGDNTGYYIQQSNVSILCSYCFRSLVFLVMIPTLFWYLLKEPEFLPGRQASIIYKGKHFGNFGIVHPQVSSDLMLRRTFYMHCDFRHNSQ